MHINSTHHVIRVCSGITYFHACCFKKIKQTSKEINENKLDTYVTHRYVCVHFCSSTDAPSRKKDQMTSKSRKIEERQIQYKDVVVLYGDDPPLGLLQGMRDNGIPVKKMESESDEDAVACRADKDTDADSDVVWALDGDRTYSLEWRVVICVGGHEARDEDGRPAGLAMHDRLHRASRCTSQLAFLVPSP